MSISSTSNRNDYVGNDSTNVYAYGFKIFLESELRVTVVDAAGLETELVLNTDYSVSGVGQTSGGNVTLINASQAWLNSGNLATGYNLTVRRVRQLKQLTDIRNQGDFYPEAHENTFDQLVMLDQQQQDELDRSLKLPETEAGSNFELPPLVNRANQFLGFNASGEPVAAATFQSGVTASAFMQTVLDDTTAPAARATLGIDGASGNVALGDLSAIIQALLFKPGFIQDDAGATPPTGWVACDGASYDSTSPTYAALYARIGNVWDTFNGQGAPGGTLFRVPKLNGMATIGAGAAQSGTVATSIRALADVLGSEAPAIIEANLPPHQHAVSITSAIESGLHTHSGTTNTDGAHANLLRTDAVGGGSLGVQRNASCDATTEENVNANNNGTHNHAFTTGNQSGNHTHLVSGNTGNGAGASTGLDVMQPSAAVNKIIKL